MKKILLWDPRFPDRRPVLLNLPDELASAAVRSGVAAAADPSEQGALTTGGPLDPGMLTEVVMATAPGRPLVRVMLPYSAVTVGAGLGVLAPIGTPVPGGPVIPNPPPAPTPTIAFGSATYSTTEGNTGTKTLTIPVNLTRDGLTGAQTVNLTYSGTATSGTDYTAPVSLTLGSSVSTGNLVLTINGDSDVEPDETIGINAALAGYPAATARTVVTVVNDDVAGPASLPRVFVLTDIGTSTEKDDYQALTYTLLHQDQFDIRGIAQSRIGNPASDPPGYTQTKDTILNALEIYAKDYPQIVAAYPDSKTAAALGAMVYQGSIAQQPAVGYSTATEASAAIIAQANAANAAGTKLNVVIWGGAGDYAQAIHDDPTIIPMVRLLINGDALGNTNTNYDPDSFAYIQSIYDGRSDGMYVSTTGSGKPTMGSGAPNYSTFSTTWIPNNAQGHGDLGDYMYSRSQDLYGYSLGYSPSNTSGLKFGDVCTLLYLYGRADLDDPTTAGPWGHRYALVSGKTNRWAFNTSDAAAIYSHQSEILSDFASRFTAIGARKSPMPTRGANTDVALSATAGNPQVGTPFGVDKHATWTGTGLTYANRVLLETAAGSGNYADAGAAPYTPVAADAGKRVKLTEVASNTAGASSVTLTTAASTAIQAAAGTGPTIYSSDTFDDVTADQNVVGRTSTSGGTWSTWASGANGVVSAATHDATGNSRTSTAVLFLSGNAPTRTCEIVADITRDDSTVTTVSGVVACAYSVKSNSAGQFYSFFAKNSTQWAISKSKGGADATTTLPAASVVDAGVNGVPPVLQTKQTHLLRVTDLNDGTLRLQGYIDGALAVDVIDTSPVPLAGSGGARLVQTARLDNLIYRSSTGA